MKTFSLLIILLFAPVLYSQEMWYYMCNEEKIQNISYNLTHPNNKKKIKYVIINGVVNVYTSKREYHENRQIKCLDLGKSDSSNERTIIPTW